MLGHSEPHVWAVGCLHLHCWATPSGVCVSAVGSESSGSGPVCTLDVSWAVGVLDVGPHAEGGGAERPKGTVRPLRSGAGVGGQV